MMFFRKKKYKKVKKVLSIETYKYKILLRDDRTKTGEISDQYQITTDQCICQTSAKYFLHDILWTEVVSLVSKNGEYTILKREDIKEVKYKLISTALEPYEILEEI
jgi:hypothetical protein